MVDDRGEIRGSDRAAWTRFAAAAMTGWVTGLRVEEAYAVQIRRERHGVVSKP